MPTQSLSNKKICNDKKIVQREKNRGKKKEKPSVVGNLSEAPPLQFLTSKCDAAVIFDLHMRCHQDFWPPQRHRSHSHNASHYPKCESANDAILRQREKASEREKVRRERAKARKARQ